MKATKQKILDELDELLDIPQIERIIFHKVEELKLYLADEIAHFREIKRYFKKLAYGEMKVLNGEDALKAGEHERKHKPEQTYYFALHKGPDEHWNAVRLGPSPPAGYDISDIVPEGIAEYIGAFETTTGKLETVTDVSLPSIKGMRFDLHFTRYSPNHVLGTIKRCPLEENIGDDADDVFIEGIYNYNKKDSQKNDYKELLYYMQKYPPLRMYFFTELHMKMKPLIKGKLVDITASSQPVDLF
jgi:hypothetical protein